LNAERNNVAWITGAGTGIGAAAAKRLARDGTHVVLSGRRRDRLEAVAREIDSATVEELDVSDASAVRSAAERIIERHGRIDTVVLSAGINVPNRAWVELTPVDWQQIQRINLDGAFNCVHAVLPQLRKQGGGLVIAVSSWAGRFPSPIAGAAYSASKSALNAMVHVLNREEGRHGIRATSLCPGEVATEILDQRPNPPSMESRQYMLQPEDMAELIAFLANCPPRMCVNEVVLSPTHTGPVEPPQS
jgi:NAD(P)-dependent dehydrogenase (short-subunit alcohol dehydrogenase family)